MWVHEMPRGLVVAPDVVGVRDLAGLPDARGRVVGQKVDLTALIAESVVLDRQEGYHGVVDAQVGVQLVEGILGADGHRVLGLGVHHSLHVRADSAPEVRQFALDRCAVVLGRQAASVNVREQVLDVALRDGLRLGAALVQVVLGHLGDAQEEVFVDVAALLGGSVLEEAGESEFAGVHGDEEALSSERMSQKSSQ